VLAFMARIFMAADVKPRPAVEGTFLDMRGIVEGSIVSDFNASFAEREADRASACRGGSTMTDANRIPGAGTMSDAEREVVECAGRTRIREERDHRERRQTLRRCA